MTEAGRQLLEQTDGPPVGDVRLGEDDPDRSWRISRHQTFVAASVSSQQLPDLLEVLAEAQQAVESSFVARIDGERHDYIFVFDQALGARPAEALSAALRAVQLPFRLGTIADLRGIDAAVRDARAARAAANAVREHRRK